MLRILAHMLDFEPRPITARPFLQVFGLVVRVLVAFLPESVEFALLYLLHRFSPLFVR